MAVVIPNKGGVIIQVLDHGSHEDGDILRHWTASMSLNRSIGKMIRGRARIVLPQWIQAELRDEYRRMTRGMQRDTLTPRHLIELWEKLEELSDLYLAEPIRASDHIDMSISALVRQRHLVLPTRTAPTERQIITWYTLDRIPESPQDFKNRKDYYLAAQRLQYVNWQVKVVDSGKITREDVINKQRVVTIRDEFSTDDLTVARVRARVG